MSKLHKLTLAFEAGVAAAKEPNKGLSSRLKYKGKARDFFEAGYFQEVKKQEKARKAREEAYRRSPAYQEQLRRERQMLDQVVEAVKTWIEAEYPIERK